MYEEREGSPCFSGSRVWRVEVRPPGPLPVSYTITWHPLWAKRDAQVRPAIPPPTTATRRRESGALDVAAEAIVATARRRPQGAGNARPRSAMLWMEGRTTVPESPRKTRPAAIIVWRGVQRRVACYWRAYSFRKK